MQPEDPPEPVSPTVRRIAGIALSSGGAALLVVHWVWPHIPFDTPTLVLLGLAALPALAVFVKSAKLPGGIELALTQLRRDTKETRQFTEEVARAQVASEAVGDQRFRELLIVSGGTAPDVPRRDDENEDVWGGAEPDGAPPVLPAEPKEPDPSGPLDRLAQQYDRLRHTMPGGPERTTLATKIVSDMTGAVSAGATVDTGAALVDPSPGRRLAGYATLIVHPEPARLGQLVDNVVDRESGTPFNRYWAIRTLGIVLEAAGRRLDPDQVTRLRALRPTLHRDHDLAYELDRVLRRLAALG